MIILTAQEFMVCVVVGVFLVFAIGFTIGYNDGQERPKGTGK